MVRTWGPARAFRGTRSHFSPACIARRPCSKPTYAGHQGIARRFSHTTTEGSLMPTIALVYDDRNILPSVSIALEAEGYRIMTYTDGASALDGFRTRQPGLSILAIKMPRTGGL